METNEELRKQIFEIIKTQINTKDPPETKKTFKRLVKEGYSKFDAKQLIGQCLAVELFGVFKKQEPFDEKGMSKT